jgi:hypothetical protein
MHSQNLEEQYILDYFGSFVGTFLDLGCNDCKTLSNTYALAERGWVGVLVDCSPGAIAKCKELYNQRRGLYIYENAVGAPNPKTKKPFNGKVVFNDSGPILNGKDSGLVGTFYAEEMERFKRITTYNPIIVQTYKWKTFHNRPVVKDYDMMSIDVEGSETNILPDMDLSKTKLIVIEHNGSAEKKKAYLECTSKYGIDKIIYESGENVLIAR